MNRLCPARGLVWVCVFIFFIPNTQLFGHNYDGLFLSFDDTEPLKPQSLNACDPHPILGTPYTVYTFNHGTVLYRQALGVSVARVFDWGFCQDGNVVLLPLHAKGICVDAATLSLKPGTYQAFLTVYWDYRYWRISNIESITLPAPK